MLPLIGILIVVAGFALRLNPLLVVAAAAVATGLAAGHAFTDVVAAFGKAFVDSRSVALLAASSSTGSRASGVTPVPTNTCLPSPASAGTSARAATRNASPSGPSGSTPRCSRARERLAALDDEDKSLRAHASNLVNAEVGYRLRSGTRLRVSLLNALNGQADDIQYAYASRLRGETSDAITDVHFHPAEPRQVRVGVNYQFRGRPN